MDNTLSKEEMRNFLVKYHNLDGEQNLKGKEGVLEYIERVGCIQYDPLNVVGRNPDLTLQSKIENYSPQILHELLYSDRKLMDGWDKMMAIYSHEDFKYFARVRDAKKIEIRHILERRKSIEALEYIEEVSGMIKEKGPLQSNQISLGESVNGKWGHKKLSSATLDYMFNIGQLGIYDKKNTQKVYELMERLIGEEEMNRVDPFKNDYEFYKWYIKRRIGSVGALWNKNGGGWLGHYTSNKKLRTTIINELMEEESIIKIAVEGIKEPFYIRNEDKKFLNQKSNAASASFLAPLDNLLWDRGMIKSLFDFEYSWEVYVPVAKRKYGYYVLPVMYKDRLVARFEPELYRGEEYLYIKNWWWEENCKIDTDMKLAIKDAFSRFCKYVGAQEVEESYIEKLV